MLPPSSLDEELHMSLESHLSLPQPTIDAWLQMCKAILCSHIEDLNEEAWSIAEN